MTDFTNCTIVPGRAYNGAKRYLQARYDLILVPACNRVQVEK